jgi:hypothetical protein
MAKTRPTGRFNKSRDVLVAARRRRVDLKTARVPPTSSLFKQFVLGVI